MSQTLQASTLLAVPLAPLVGAALAGILGTRFGGNWIGRRLTHTLTILGVLIAFMFVRTNFAKPWPWMARVSMKPSTPGWWWVV